MLDTRYSVLDARYRAAEISAIEVGLQYVKEPAGTVSAD